MLPGLKFDILCLPTLVFPLPFHHPPVTFDRSLYRVRVHRPNMTTVIPKCLIQFPINSVLSICVHWCPFVVK